MKIADDEKISLVQTFIEEEEVSFVNEQPHRELPINHELNHQLNRLKKNKSYNEENKFQQKNLRDLQEKSDDFDDF